MLREGKNRKFIGGKKKRWKKKFKISSQSKKRWCHFLCGEITVTHKYFKIVLLNQINRKDVYGCVLNFIISFLNELIKKYFINNRSI